jgi:hypothetical protein
MNSPTNMKAFQAEAFSTLTLKLNQRALNAQGVVKEKSRTMAM